MAKALYNENLLQGNVIECFFTKDPTDLCIHHIFRGAFRDKATKYGCWIWLRPDWHNQTNYAIHNDKKLEMKLQAMCQMAFEDKYNHELFMKEFRRDYIEAYKNKYGNLFCVYNEWKIRKRVLAYVD